MQKVLVITGPTAVGKSDFGISVAKELDGEIISGDSVQIYRGLDIGSGKITKAEMQGIRHYLIDTKDPFEDYSVAEFQKEARFLIDKIAVNGHLPIIVGGTGLYIKAVLYDYEFNEEVIKDEEYDDLSNEEIYEILKKVDPKCLDKIHINNRKRLIRALNIYHKTNKGISAIKDAQKHEMIYDALIISLSAPREQLYQRIDKRVDMMFEKGLEKEVETLLKNGLTFEHKALSAIGYRQFKDYFEGKITLDEVKELIKRDSRRFAKRQYTWFRHQFKTEWFDIGDLDKALIRIKEWYDE